MIEALDDEEGEKTVTEQAVHWKAEAETVLDVRPDLESGGEPFVRIMEAASTIQPDGTLVIIAPFEPVPLYDVLGARGFGHETAWLCSAEKAAEEAKCDLTPSSRSRYASAASIFLLIRANFDTIPIVVYQ